MNEKRREQSEAYFKLSSEKKKAAKEAGICVRCLVKEARTDKIHCTECARIVANTSRKSVDKKISEHRCIECSNFNDRHVTFHVHCTKCAAKRHLKSKFNRLKGVV